MSDADFSRHAQFCIKARVCAVIEDGLRVVLEDNGVRAMADWPDGPAPAPGDSILAKGVTSVNKWGDRLLSVESFSTDGHDEPPAPVAATAKDMEDAALDLRQVAVDGTVEDVFEDETDRRWIYIVLRSADGRIYLTIPKRRISQSLADSLADASVSATGTCLQDGFGHRPHFGAHVCVADESDIRIIRPASDPFAAPPLDGLRGLRRETIANSCRRRAEGCVKAVWSDSDFLLGTKGGQSYTVRLAKGRVPPEQGRHVEVTGYPQTDFFSLRLVGGDWRYGGADITERREVPALATVEALFIDRHGNQTLKPECHGRLFRARGRVRRISAARGFAEMSVEIDGADIFFNDGGTGAFAALEPDSVVEATGVCVLLSGLWDAQTPFPHANGYVFVARSRDDVITISHPPWWTPGRLVAVICVLVACIVAVSAWNRWLNKIVERRSRQLLKEQVATVEARLKTSERTRLAIELHDALSQSLAAVAYQVAAAKSACPASDERAAETLAGAERMLLSCRTELRRCLIDLRGDALEEPYLSGALKKVLGPVAGDAAVEIDFDVPRTRLSDSTAHSILCVVRELAANAAVHGKARHIRIEGCINGENLSFSVRDDGCGFDPAACRGPDTGHFGLDGARRRMEKLGGKFDIAPAPGGGMLAKASIPVRNAGAAGD